MTHEKICAGLYEVQRVSRDEAQAITLDLLNKGYKSSKRVPKIKWNEAEKLIELGLLERIKGDNS